MARAVPTLRVGTLQPAPAPSKAAVRVNGLTGQHAPADPLATPIPPPAAAAAAAPVPRSLVPAPTGLTREPVHAGHLLQPTLPEALPPVAVQPAVLVRQATIVWMAAGACRTAQARLPVAEQQLLLLRPQVQNRHLRLHLLQLHPSLHLLQLPVHKSIKK